MTVKRYGSGPGGAFSGKPAVHPATVDLKGKSYEYVILCDFLESLLCNVYAYSEFQHTSFALHNIGR